MKNTQHNSQDNNFFGKSLPSWTLSIIFKIISTNLFSVWQ